MTCDVCDGPCWDDSGPAYEIRRHPANPLWHIHLCARCGLEHDYRELAKIMIGDV